MGKSITELSSVTTVGLDLAKHVFHVHDVDAFGRAIIAKALRRKDVLGFFAQLPRCLIGLEACGSAYHWAARALSRCRTIDANDLVDDRAYAAAVAERHVFMAEARKARCVPAEMRWRCTLKVLWAAA